MKVHLQPETILLSRPSIVWQGVEKLMKEYGLSLTDWAHAEDERIYGADHEIQIDDGDKLAELMGRLCYASFGPRQGRVGAEAYLANVLEGGHGSVLEHANWSFVVVGAGRGFTHQMVRHRAGFAFSQESQHFIRYGLDAGDKNAPEAAVCLGGVDPESESGRQMVEGAAEAVARYEHLWKSIRASFPEDSKRKSALKKRVSGVARGLLPAALESKLGFTGNGRALRHFCQLRGTPDNVPEIRIVACQVAKIMAVEAPAIFQDLELFVDEDGEMSVNSMWKKV